MLGVHETVVDVEEEKVWVREWVRVGTCDVVPVDDVDGVMVPLLDEDPVLDSECDVVMDPEVVVVRVIELELLPLDDIVSVEERVCEKLWDTVVL